MSTNIYNGHGISWKIGDRLKHKSGRIYEIKGFANVSVIETDKFPHQAIYENIVNKTLWTRPIKDMVSRFVELNV